MVLEICSSCVHGDVKDGHSHCDREAVYSYLTNCIRRIALREYLERNTVNELPVERAINE